jgi:hypothetical protein
MLPQATTAFAYILNSKTPAQPTSIRPIRRFTIQIADKINQLGMPKHLAYRHVFARVIPIMVDHALHEVAKAGRPIRGRAAEQLL